MSRVVSSLTGAIPRCASCRTVDKVTVMGSCFMDELSAHIDPAHIPATIGGDYPEAEQAGEPFAFDTSEGGLLWMPENA